MENQNELATALAKAQGEITAPLKNRKVDFTDKNGRRVAYNYADLADVIEALKGPLSKNGLSILHQLEASDAGYGMITTLLHSSGQKVDTYYPLPDPRSMRPQEFGSAITYGRRYSVSMITGIASEEDDDGAEAPAPKKPETPIQKPKPKIVPPAALSVNDEEMVPTLVKIVRYAQEKGITNDEMKSFIKRVTGTEKKSTELNQDELESLFKYLKMTKP